VNNGNHAHVPKKLKREFGKRTNSTEKKPLYPRTGFSATFGKRARSTKQKRMGLPR